MDSNNETEDGMEIAQKHGGTKIRYVFRDERLEYAWESSSLSRSFSVEYTGVSHDRESLTEKNAWYRNLGFLWMALGCLLIAASWMEPGPPAYGAGLTWLCVGAGSYAFFRCNIKRYVILPSERGNLLFFDNGTGRRILEQIECRRAAQFREEYDFFPEGEPPEQLRKRFRWLRDEGALSDEELAERMSRVDAIVLLSELEGQSVNGRLEG